MGDKMDQKIGFIGAGNMAKAICEGMVKKGLFTYNQITVSAPSESTLECWRKLGANVTHDNGKIIEDNEIIFLAVKPHILKAAISEAVNSFDNSNKKIPTAKLFVSILVGLTLETLQRVLIRFESKIIRVMPNTPMMVGEGCIVYCPAQHVDSSDICTVEKILSSSGKCTRVPENLIDAVGALAGSGPAFIYLVIEAMSDAGVKMGLPRKMAMEMAAQTVLGAGKMVLETEKHPGVLKDEVCSPGGTTITGIHELEKSAVRAAFINAIETTAKKSVELGKLN